MFATTDRASCGTQDQQHRTDHERDDAQRPQDRDLDEQADDEQDDARVIMLCTLRFR
ncbi:hypothetical protein GS435_14360 [Rhodococcus hoagii]|nr:hypothetical protein [Prescottella equi]